MPYQFELGDTVYYIKENQLMCQKIIRRHRLEEIEATGNHKVSDIYGTIHGNIQSKDLYRSTDDLFANLLDRL